MKKHIIDFKRGDSPISVSISGGYACSGEVLVLSYSSMDDDTEIAFKNLADEDIEFTIPEDSLFVTMGGALSPLPGHSNVAVNVTIKDEKKEVEEKIKLNRFMVVIKLHS